MKNPIRNRIGTLIGTTETRNDGVIELRNRNGTLVGTEDTNGRTCDRNGVLKATGRGSLSALMEHLQ